VFISYGSDDVALARELRRHLEKGGYSCWMAPDDVAGPRSWAEHIVQSIASCKVVLVLISSVANRSTHVSKEVDLALEHGKAVLPVRVEDVAPSGALQYLLALAQWIDAFPGGLGPHADEVRKRVAAIIEAEAAPSDAPAVESPAPMPVEGRVPVSPPQVAPPGHGADAKRRHTWLVGIGAALAAIAVVIGIVWLTGRGDAAPSRYGDDVVLDMLWDGCYDGDMGACDELMGAAVGGTEYADYASTCGYRLGRGGECAARFTAQTYGDDPGLDQLWDRCNAAEFDACDDLRQVALLGSEYEWWGGSCGGRVEGLQGCDAVRGEGEAVLFQLAGECEEGWMESCDELFRVAPEGSDFHELGATCAFRKEGPPCAFTYGDAPRLDELWNACAEGVMEACDELWITSAVDSEYEQFAGTCGYRTDGDTAGACATR
jgi:hypothetical protein